MLSSVKAFHPQQLCKRDGSIAAFDLGKIRQAIIAAGEASGDFVLDSDCELKDSSE